jgi:dephospho-CoA kinase
MAMRGQVHFVALIAGLTGGLACGKSFVASEFARLGCRVVEADALGHAVLAPGGEAHEAVVKAFGTADRARLASVVFQDPEAMAQLNAIVHPAVRRLARQQFQEIARADPHAVIIYAAAILVETGGYREVDKLIVVACTREQQMARAMERPKATEADVLARLDRQWPLQKKLPYADYVIDTGGTREETLDRTKIVFEELRRLAS